MRRAIISGTALALFAGCVVGSVAAPAAASPRASSRAADSRAISHHSGSIARADTVNVATLPRYSRSKHGAVRIPLRRGPQSPSSAASALPGGATAARPLVTVTPGTPLSGTLGDGNNSALGEGQLTPPDMGFAANGTKEVELINLVGKIWTGTTPGTAFSLASFFSPSSPGDSLSDPWIKWDAGSGRFFAGIFDISLGGEIIAVSQTSNPGGSWNLYRVRYPSTAGGITAGGCPDQGKGGVDSNVVGLGFNEFSESGVAGCPNAATFQGAALEVFNKSQMMAGATVNFTFTDPLSELLLPDPRRHADGFSDHRVLLLAGFRHRDRAASGHLRRGPAGHCHPDSAGRHHGSRLLQPAQGSAEGNNVEDRHRR